MEARISDILTLKKLSFTKDLVSITDIPKPFLDDFNKFFFGKTLLKKEDSLFAYPHDIKQWIHFIYNKYNE